MGNYLCCCAAASRAAAEAEEREKIRRYQELVSRRNAVADLALELSHINRNAPVASQHLEGAL